MRTLKTKDCTQRDLRGKDWGQPVSRHCFATPQEDSAPVRGGSRRPSSRHGRPARCGKATACAKSKGVRARAREGRCEAGPLAPFPPPAPLPDQAMISQFLVSLFDLLRASIVDWNGLRNESRAAVAGFPAARNRQYRRPSPVDWSTSPGVRDCTAITIAPVREDQEATDD